MTELCEKTAERIVLNRATTAMTRAPNDMTDNSKPDHSSDNSLRWTPPPRPDWLARVNEEGRGMDSANIVPLDPDELIATAQRISGFTDFGDDDWREPYRVLIDAINNEAELNLFGRLMTRSDVLLWLQARLGIEAAYREHPEIDDEVIDAPVFVTGLPRSGTSILFEILARDPQFGSVRNWEMVFPYPPPEQATYETDPRIARADHLITQLARVTPTYATMHEMGANIPNECILAHSPTFRTEYFNALFQIPSYFAYLMQVDMVPVYAYYKRMLKMLQWKNPRRHWLLKAPSHLGNLPTIFNVFPDARVIFTHRDPIKAFASNTNLLGTFYWMRSDKAFDASAFESLLSHDGVAARLETVIDWVERGAIPREQVYNWQYADLIQRPIEAIRTLYAKNDMEFSAQAEANMRAYMAAKPQGKFGAHTYSVGEKEEIAKNRALYRRYQAYYGVADEV